MKSDSRPRLVGNNHVALEVGDIEEALRFYGQIFTFELRGTHQNDEGVVTVGLIDMGDQFFALSKGRHQAPDNDRHFGLVVDDREPVARLARAAGATIRENAFLDFLDPWGNRIDVVQYDQVHFTKTKGVLRSQHLSLDRHTKTRRDIRDKGMD